MWAGVTRCDWCDQMILDVTSSCSRHHLAQAMSWSEQMWTPRLQLGCWGCWWENDHILRIKGCTWSTLGSDVDFWKTTWGTLVTEVDFGENDHISGIYSWGTLWTDTDSGNITIYKVWGTLVADGNFGEMTIYHVFIGFNWVPRYLMVSLEKRPYIRYL